MANKLRPKKLKAPYRVYVAGEGFSKVEFSRIRNQTTELEGETSEDDSVVSISSNDVFPLQKMDLPWEIQKNIIFFLDDIKVSYLSVCKSWYSICLPILYYKPILNPHNFNKFVSTIISDRKRPIGNNVIELDLSTILQSGKNSNVSKILRRCSKNLLKFTAPQTSFGYSPLISLKSCINLKYLDLGLVSETVKLKELFQAIQNFKNLTHLAFPRSSINCEGHQEFVWPSNLQYLKLSGGITKEFLNETKMWPKSIKTLEFSYCPLIDDSAVYSILSQIGYNLDNLYFHYPMPLLTDNSLDFIFCYCTNLISIQLIVDYVSKWCFSENMLFKINDRPLRNIMLDCSGSLGLARKIHPDDFTIALLEKRLPNLEKISINSKLGWDLKSEDVNDLVNALEEQDGGLYLNY
ncbi:hypothetical protein KAFR_0E01270 [Kazachstania africana CBS 2517]|uniref:F-box domain-containing protein n=1 Tax=Kazachstania africana (strain ATCC 22294 / BCRC 22015 / CBS 2517 / CECT 1963 / NBRC 1671 / NRRL Y-8276) TaxID=1071382 RepID=H2AV81_KAZAF|nr:hypothetical protein KAFR_0E01270 [Kazachstania africana CBS 2517]CCF58281.1 hypothetical protein KAFR_0E01270 [Kazachstania africana CBS 2517]